MHAPNTHTHKQKLYEDVCTVQANALKGKGGRGGEGGREGRRERERGKRRKGREVDGRGSCFYFYLIVKFA